MPSNKHVVCIRVSDDILSEIRRIAVDREWTLAHAALYLIRCGLSCVLCEEVSNDA